MANSIRIHPTISLVAHQHLEAAIARGETLSGIINRLLIHQLPKPDGTTASGTPNKTPISTLRANLKNIQNKITAKREEHEIKQRKQLTITPSEYEELYDLMRNAAEIRHQLGEGDHPDDVMRRQYRQALDRRETDYEYETLRYDANQMTEEGVRQYKELEGHINVLKDRLK